MTDRDYERAERRRRTREKGKITSIVAVGVIVLALIAIIIVVIAVIGKNQPSAPAEETVAATEQPTLYVPSTTAQAPTERATTAAQPTASPSYDETEAAWDDQDEPDVSDESDDSGAASDTSQNSASSVAGALHYYAYGGTSGGYNWTYDSMGDVSVTCKYNFDEGQYDFSITGLSPGETSLTLIYYTADDQSVEVPLSVRVNDDLSVDLL